jgi:hypothetical protein
MTAPKKHCFTIYHIPGLKVGCTSNFKKRQKAYPEGTIFEVIEVLEGISEEAAGNREWEWADHYGYQRGGFYANHWGNHITDEMKSVLGKKGGNALAAQGRKWGPQSDDHREKIGAPQRGVPRKKHDAASKANLAAKLKGATVWVVKDQSPVKVRTEALQDYLSAGYQRGRKLKSGGHHDCA